ncbi:MAG TPA: periplasmic heavy metal sensor [Alphaproteobacteria bacterium]|nr:periplasmic heavy metal sensor [Alphaproteobacteria bacterium]
MTKRIKIIFTLSVLLNILLAGVVAGHFIQKDRYHRPPMELDQQTREKMKASFEKSREEMREFFQEMRKQRDALDEIISAPEFDRAAYDTAVSDILESKGEIVRKKAVMMGGMLSDMSVEERRKMAPFIVRGLTSDRSKPPHKRGQERGGRNPEK